MMEDGNDPHVKIQTPVATHSMRFLVVCLVAAILVMILIAALTLH
jgi:hypothetical protein